MHLDNDLITNSSLITFANIINYVPLSVVWCFTLSKNDGSFLMFCKQSKNCQLMSLLIFIRFINDITQL